MKKQSTGGWILLVGFFLLSISFAWAQNKLDSLHQELKLVADSAQTRLYHQLSEAHKGRADDSLFFYAHKARRFAKKYKQTFQQGRIEHTLGSRHYFLGKYDSAAHYLYASLKTMETSSDQQGKMYSLTLLGQLHRKQQELDKSLERFEEVLRLAQNLGDSAQIATSHNNIGISLNMQGKLDAALVHYNQCSAIKTALNDRYGLSYDYNNIAEIWAKKGDYEKAGVLVAKGLAIKREFKDGTGVAMSLANLGEIEFQKGDYRQARTYLWEALDSAAVFRYLDFQQYLLQQISASYGAEDNFKKELEFYKKHIALKDSIFNENKTKQLAQLQTQYETEKKERQIAQQNLKIETSNLTIEHQKYQIGGLIALLVVLLLLAIVYYNNYKAKQKNKLQTAIILEQEKGFRAVFDATEKERKRIAKDLHDGVGQLLSGLKLAWQNLKDDIETQTPETAASLHKITQVLDEVAQETRSISHQMMPKTLTELGLVPAIRDSLEKSLGLSGISYEFEHYQVEEKRFKERIELAVYRILQELINNIIKHSEAQEVKVQLLKSKSRLILLVEDNGKGFNPHKEGAGHGLHNIKSRLNTIKGKVDYQPNEEQGMVATVSIPLV